MGHSHSTRKPELAISDRADEEFLVMEEVAKFSFVGDPK
jgi:hypothetical protein